MDKLDLYRQLIQELLTVRAKLCSAKYLIKSQTVFDREGEHYQLVNLG